jgi:hypothetical protein
MRRFIKSKQFRLNLAIVSEYVVTTMLYRAKNSRELKKLSIDGVMTFHPDDRLFEPINKIVYLIDGFMTSFSLAILRAGNALQNPKLPIRAEVGCNLFDTILQFQLQEPFDYIARNEVFPFVKMAVNSNKIENFAAFRRERTTYSGLNFLFLGLITPVFVDFFEQHRACIRNKFGQDTSNWPPIFNFVRAVRNFISHHQGKVHFDNPNAANVYWHHLKYSPADTGRLAVGYGGDFIKGDLILLLIEFGREMDKHGLPIPPLSLPQLEDLAKERRRNSKNP